MNKKGSTGYLTWDDLRELITNLREEERLQYKNEQFAFMLQVGCRTGMRISETLGLKWTDILSGGNYLLDQRKTGKMRRVTITEPLLDHAKQYYLFLGSPGREKHIFVKRYTNKPFTREYVNRHLKVIFAKYDLMYKGDKVASHLMRKTWGRNTYDHFKGEKGVIHLIMDAFGHSSEAITLRYLGIRQEEVEDLYNVLP